MTSKVARLSQDRTSILAVPLPEFSTLLAQMSRNCEKGVSGTGENDDKQNGPRSTFARKLALDHGSKRDQKMGSVCGVNLYTLFGTCEKLTIIRRWKR